MGRGRSRVRAALKKLAGDRSKKQDQLVSSAGLELTDRGTEHISEPTSNSSQDDDGLSSSPGEVLPDEIELIGETAEPNQQALPDEIELIEDKPDQQTLPDEIELIEEKPSQQALPDEIELIEEKPDQQTLPDEIELIEEKPDQQTLPDEIELIEETAEDDIAPKKKSGKKRRRKFYSRATEGDSSGMAIAAFLGLGVLLVIVVVAVTTGGDSNHNEDVQLYQNSAGEIITREEFEAIENWNMEVRKAALAKETKQSPPASRAAQPRNPAILTNEELQENSSTAKAPIIADHAPQTDGPLPGWMRGNFSSDEIPITTATTTPETARETSPTSPTTTERISEPPPVVTESAPTTEPDEPIDLRNAEGWP